MASCKECDGRCCKYVATEIDGPFTKDDFDVIKWYLCHKDVLVYLDHEDEWMLEVGTKCKFIGDDNKCNNYEERPDICRDYGLDECEMFGTGTTHKVIFKEPADVEKYVKDNNIELKDE